VPHVRIRGRPGRQRPGRPDFHSPSSLRTGCRLRAANSDGGPRLAGVPEAGRRGGATERGAERLRQTAVRRTARSLLRCPPRKMGPGTSGRGRGTFTFTLRSRLRVGQAQCLALGNFAPRVKIHAAGPSKPEQAEIWSAPSLARAGASQMRSAA